MKKALFTAAILGAFVLGSVAQAQVPNWLFWGASQAVTVPVSASNPLPVQCN